MLLALQREPSANGATIGRLSVDGRHECYTCEDVVRPGQEKVRGATAIPEGPYRVVITQSRRFGVPMPLLLDVPGFEGIRIHWGNTAADTEGCILVGVGFVGDRVTDSQVAYRRLFAQIQAALDAGEEVWVDISQRSLKPPTR